MNQQEIIRNLELNKTVFEALLSSVSESMSIWKPSPDNWCLMEILCHLVDEEKEDFRVRTKLVLEHPDQDPPAIDPPSWVIERKYMEQDFGEKLKQWLTERQRSIDWLKSLANTPWDNTYQHPKLGPRTAFFYLANWLAHDYLHIRQINRTKFEYLSQHQNEDLYYAGNW